MVVVLVSIISMSSAYSIILICYADGADDVDFRARPWTHGYHLSAFPHILWGIMVVLKSTEEIHAFSNQEIVKKKMC